MLVPFPRAVALSFCTMMAESFPKARYDDLIQSIKDLEVTLFTDDGADYLRDEFSGDVYRITEGLFNLRKVTLLGLETNTLPRKIPFYYQYLILRALDVYVFNN